MEHIETVIIGGGQAGLSVGYYLQQQGRDFVILDAHERIGDAWRKRSGLAAPVHARPLQRPRRDALPCSTICVPHEGRDGRLPGVLTRRASSCR